MRLWKRQKEDQHIAFNNRSLTHQLCSYVLIEAEYWSRNIACIVNPNLLAKLVPQNSEILVQENNANGLNVAVNFFELKEQLVLC